MGKLKEILETKQFPGITGTRDSFGIKNAFIDRKTGKEITTWKEWERAGYTNPKDDPNIPHDVKEGIKRKVDKIGFDKGRRKSIGG